MGWQGLLYTTDILTSYYISLSSHASSGEFHGLLQCIGYYTIFFVYYSFSLSLVAFVPSFVFPYGMPLSSSCLVSPHAFHHHSQMLTLAFSTLLLHPSLLCA